MKRPFSRSPKKQGPLRGQQWRTVSLSKVPRGDWFAGVLEKISATVRETRSRAGTNQPTTLLYVRREMLPKKIKRCTFLWVIFWNRQIWPQDRLLVRAKISDERRTASNRGCLPFSWSAGSIRGFVRDSCCRGRRARSIRRNVRLIRYIQIIENLLLTIFKRLVVCSVAGIKCRARNWHKFNCEQFSACWTREHELAHASE